MYRVVARPVEYEVGSLPAGAIVGARIVDDRFARELTDRTGAAVAFYVNGQRVAAGAPEGFAKANLDQIVSDLDDLAQDKDYQEKGRSAVREIGGMLGVQYTRLPGESYDLGAGYVAARLPQHVECARCARIGFGMREVPWIDEIQRVESHRLHRARGGADIAGVTRLRKHHANIFERIALNRLNHLEYAP